jgi:serine phosphatase RsbU (regulator of sigma subunit)
VVSKCLDKSADAIVESLFKAVADHAGAEDAFDDETIVAVKVKGGSGKKK